MFLELCKEFSFEASHLLPKHPGKCSRLHGHSWKLHVYVQGEVNEETGFVMDYADLKKVVQPTIDRLDHRHLGTWPDGIDGEIYGNWKVPGMEYHFYPSSENLIVWIAKELDKSFNWVVEWNNTWSRLELDETCSSKCILLRDQYERNVGSRRKDSEAEQATAKAGLGKE